MTGVPMRLQMPITRYTVQSNPHFAKITRQIQRERGRHCTAKSGDNNVERNEKHETYQASMIATCQRDTHMDARMQHLLRNMQSHVQAHHASITGQPLQGLYRLQLQSAM